MTAPSTHKPKTEDFFVWNMRTANAGLKPEDNSLMSQDEYDELFERMAHEDLPEDCMSAEQADGYMTACAIGPDMPGVHEWLPAILGKEELPILPDEAAQERLLHLLLRRWRDILDRVRITKDQATIDTIFMPLFGEVDPNDLITPYRLDKTGMRIGCWKGKDWAQGFRQAMFDDPVWELLFNDKEHLLLVGIIMLIDQGYNSDKPEFQLEDMPDLLGNLVVCVLALRDYWRNYNRDVSAGKRPPYLPGWNDIDFGAAERYASTGQGLPFMRTEEKIGRNDPCLCGSGKKYKKCCGA
jgi:uncharacterized protein